MTSAQPPAWIAEHRALLTRKASLRAVYTQWCRELRAACVPGTSVVELGCGPGLLKEVCPDVVATDIVPNPFADRIVDAEALPFADNEIGNLVLLDVFHHLPRPEQFLRETARVLRGRGRLVMLEPWTGGAGRLLYRYVHHEDCDFTVDPAAPWNGGTKDPMHGNAALPWLFFRAGGQLERMGLPLRVTQRRRFAGLPWLLTGGFQPINLMPVPLLGLAERFDRLLSLAPMVTATRCMIVVERDE